MATLTLTLRDDLLAKAQQQAELRNISLADVIEEAVESLATPKSTPADLDEDSIPPEQLTYEQWKRRFDRTMDWIRANSIEYPPGFQVDDSRESIYGGSEERGQ